MSIKMAAYIRSLVMKQKHYHPVGSFGSTIFQQADLMGLFEKRRFRKLLVWVMNIRAENPETWNDVYQPPKDIARDPIMHAFEHFEISEDTQVSFYTVLLCSGFLALKV